MRACGVTCEEDDDCQSVRAVEQSLEGGRAVNVCADLVNSCQGSPCDEVNCEAGSVCDPSNGDCVGCLNDDDCNTGEACVDQSCIMTRWLRPAVFFMG